MTVNHFLFSDVALAVELVHCRSNNLAKVRTVA